MEISTEVYTNMENLMEKDNTNGKTEQNTMDSSNQVSEKEKGYGRAKQETSTKVISAQTEKTGMDSSDGPMATFTKESFAKI